MTSNQIFKINVDINLLFNLLDLICKKTPNYYIFNFDSYKKGIYHNYIQIFFKDIRDNYHISKQKYIDRKLNYNSFITVMRQILKSNNIFFTHKIEHSNGEYSIIYNIYYVNKTDDD